MHIIVVSYCSLEIPHKIYVIWFNTSSRLAKETAEVNLPVAENLSWKIACKFSPWPKLSEEWFQENLDSLYKFVYWDTKLPKV